MATRRARGWSSRPQPRWPKWPRGSTLPRRQPPRSPTDAGDHVGDALGAVRTELLGELKALKPRRNLLGQNLGRRTVLHGQQYTEESSVGKGGVSTWRNRW